MDKKWVEYFSDREYWEKQVQTYIATGTAPGKTPLSQVGDLWDYFKFCILTDNRFFFEHPLLEVVKTKIGEHIITLPANTTIFRARIDTNDILKEQVHNLMQVNILTELKKNESITEKVEVDKMIARFTGTDGYDSYQEQHKNGFEGFSEEESMCPPPYKVSHGRCNLPNSPHLYASADIHTAIAETRPYIRDTVSIASICCDKDLRIVDFCFDWDDQENF